METATAPKTPPDCDPYDLHLAIALVNEYAAVGMNETLALRLLTDGTVEPWKASYLAVRAANSGQTAA